MNFSFDLFPEQEDPQGLKVPCSRNLDYISIVKSATRVKRRFSRRKEKPYYWTESEQQRYLKFLLKRGDWFQLTRSERKNLKINVVMSNMVQTRSAQQCHTHHQKMMDKYGSIEEIIRNESPLVNLPDANKKHERSPLKLKDQADKTVPKKTEVEVICEKAIPNPWDECVEKFLNISSLSVSNWLSQ